MILKNEIKDLPKKFDWRSGKSFIHKSADIAKSVTLIEPVWIGENAKIGPGATIGPETFIGDNAQIGGRANLSKTRVGENAHVGTSVSAQESVINSGSKIAAAVSLKAGAQIGKEVVVGKAAKIDAAAVVGRNTVVGDRTSIGKEAQIAEDCTIELLVKIGAGAKVGASTQIGRAAELGAGARVGARNVLEAKSRLGKTCSLGNDNLVAAGRQLSARVWVGSGHTFLADSPVAKQGVGRNDKVSLSPQDAAGVREYYDTNKYSDIEYHLIEKKKIEVTPLKEMMTLLLATPEAVLEEEDYPLPESDLSFMAQAEQVLAKGQSYRQEIYDHVEARGGRAGVAAVKKNEELEGALNYIDDMIKAHQEGCELILEIKGKKYTHVSFHSDTGDLVEHLMDAYNLRTEQKTKNYD